MDATLRVLEAAGAQLELKEIELGQAVYQRGETSGIAPETWEVLGHYPVILKGPLTTPQGGSFKSVNVTLRKSLGLYANVRPCKAYAPYVRTQHPDQDLVIIRENEEDLYAGIEHQQTDEVVQCLKLISRPGCERIVRYAFDFARIHGRRRVTCMTKDNIMKQTDGLFHQVFREIAAEYPDIDADHMIIDIGAARLAVRPAQFDVIVTLNLYGDILSDIAAELTGSVGMAGSANIGLQGAMFEAIHGSAPDLAGKNLANPSGLLNAAVMMLAHLGQADAANRIANAWLSTLEHGIHTQDIFQRGTSFRKVGTRAFGDEVIARLSEQPKVFQPAAYTSLPVRLAPDPGPQRRESHKELVGADIFLHEGHVNPDTLGELLESLTPAHLRLKMVTNRGVKVYPGGIPSTFLTDHWRCRFVSTEADISDPLNPRYRPVSYDDVLALLGRLHARGLRIIKTEHLYLFDGERGFSLGQGE